MHPVATYLSPPPIATTFGVFSETFMVSVLDHEDVEAVYVQSLSVLSRPVLTAYGGFLE